jgi:hypothetical protein
MEDLYRAEGLHPCLSVKVFSYREVGVPTKKTKQKRQISHGREREHNWVARDSALSRVIYLVEEGVAQSGMLIRHWECTIFIDYLL